jgi:ParB family transcriptional regulator, chromosome partitioning protein
METNQTNQNGYSDNLPIGDIFVKEGFNPRKYFDPTEHLELVSSIKENGIVQPIVVRPVTKGTGGFWVVCGERRFRAAKDAGLSHVPSVVRELSEASAMVIAIIENAQRANITPAEEAQSARDVLMGCGNDRQEAIRLLGWSQSKFDSRMLLLHADQAVLDALTERKIKLGHAELLSQLPTDFQVNTLAKIIAEGFSVSDLKGKLALFSLDLSKACFDKAECQTCPHNSMLQASVFDEHIEGGKCANHDCYGVKTKAAMEIKKVGLSEQYAVVFLDTERTKGSYAINCQLGQNGVGKAQFEQGCRQCAHFGALLNTSPDQIGKVTEDCCFNLECHKEKVATYQASIKPEPATTTGKPANKTTATVKKGRLASGDTKKPSNDGTGASAAMIPGKVTEKIETFYRDLAAKTVTENQRLMLCLNTFTLLRFVKSSFVDELWPDSIRKNASVTLELDRFLKRLSTLDTQEIKAFNQRLVRHFLAEHEKSAPISTKTWAKGASEAVNQLNINLSGHFLIDREFLGSFTKSGIESILLEAVNGKGQGFVAQYEAQGEGKKFSSLVKKKNGKILDEAFGCGYDFTGFVPACVFAFMGEDKVTAKVDQLESVPTLAGVTALPSGHPGSGRGSNQPEQVVGIGDAQGTGQLAEEPDGLEHTNQAQLSTDVNNGYLGLDYDTDSPFSHNFSQFEFTADPEDENDDL